MSFRRTSLWLAACGLIVLGLARAEAQNAQKPLSAADQATLDNLAAQRRADERKSDANRQTARQIAQEIEDLRQQIVDISKRQGASEQRSAVYRARLETINLQ